MVDERFEKDSFSTQEYLYRESRCKCIGGFIVPLRARISLMGFKLWDFSTTERGPSINSRNTTPRRLTPSGFMAALALELVRWLLLLIRDCDLMALECIAHRVHRLGLRILHDAVR